jgi:hypothetical protein
MDFADILTDGVNCGRALFPKMPARPSDFPPRRPLYPAAADSAPAMRAIFEKFFHA